MAQTVQETLQLDQMPIPDFAEQRSQLKKVFPKDLWESEV